MSGVQPNIRATWRILPLIPARTRLPVARFWGLRAKRFLEVVTNGPFEELLGDSAQLWLGFCAWLTEEGHDRAILRLYAGEEAGGPYFLWVVYRIVREGEAVGLRVEAMVLPKEDPDTRLSTPEEVEGEPFFAFPPGEPRPPDGRLEH